MDQIDDNDDETDESISLPGVLKGMDSEEFFSTCNNLTRQRPTDPCNHLV